MNKMDYFKYCLQDGMVNWLEIFFLREIFFREFFFRESFGTIFFRWKIFGEIFLIWVRVGVVSSYYRPIRLHVHRAPRELISQVQDAQLRV